MHKLERTALFLLLLVLLFHGTQPLAAQVNKYPPCSLGLPGECTTTVWNQLGNALNQTSQALGQALGAALVQLRDQLKVARGRVFSGNLHGAQLQEAQGQLADLLTSKDYYLCLVDTILAPRGPGMSGPGGAFYNQLGDITYKNFADFDGNIPPFARAQFNLWAGQVSDHAEGSHASSISGLISKYQSAIEATKPAYERYEIARDWAEYAAAGRNLTDDPKQYLISLIAIVDSRSQRSTGGRSELLERSTEMYSDMVHVFGSDAVDRSTRALMQAKKNRDAQLDPPYVLKGAEFSDPWAAFVGHVGETSERNYALAQFAFDDRGDISGGTPTDLQNAEKEFGSLVSAHGQDAVIHVIKIVRDAPKQSNERLSDARVIGSSNEIPARAIKDLLNQPSGTTAASSSATMVDNPEYLGWKAFKPGTTVVYIDDGGFRSNVIIIAYTLKSIDSHGATLIMHMGTVESNPDIVHVDDQPTSLPAKLSTVAPPKTSGGDNRGNVASAVVYVPPSETGTETLKIAGQVLECQWKKQGGVITWTSSRVPSGIVMRHGKGSSRYVLYQPQLPDVGAIHSMNDIRREVTSVSAGPYADEVAPKSNPAPAKKPASSSSSKTAPAPARPLTSAAVHPSAPTSAASTAVHESHLTTPTTEASRKVDQPAGRPVTPPRSPTFAQQLVGHPILVSTIDPITLGGIRGGRTFRATLLAPVSQGSQILLPIGTEVILKAVRVESPHPASGFEYIDVTIDHISLKGKETEVQSSKQPIRLRTQISAISGGRPVRYPQNQIEVVPNTRFSFRL